MGNTENNLKVLEEFCDFDASLSAASTPCEPGSKEYYEMLSEMDKESNRRRQKANEEQGKTANIIYGNKF